MYFIFLFTAIAPNQHFPRNFYPTKQKKIKMHAYILYALVLIQISFVTSCKSCDDNFDECTRKIVAAKDDLICHLAYSFCVGCRESIELRVLKNKLKKIWKLSKNI